MHKIPAMLQKGHHASRPKAIIHGVGTVNPESSMYQKDMLDLFLNHDGFHTVQSKTKKRNDFLKAVFAGSMIEKRHITCPNFLIRGDDIGIVMKQVREVGLPLTVEGSKRAMREAGVEAQDIKKLIFVTSTDLIAPGIDSMLVEQLGLAKDTPRANIFFMGCAAAITALTTAKDFCVANPEEKCLVVCLELFTFHAGHDEGNDMAVYMSLFGDGCGIVISK